MYTPTGQHALAARRRAKIKFQRSMALGRALLSALIVAATAALSWQGLYAGYLAPRRDYSVWLAVSVPIFVVVAGLGVLARSDRARAFSALGCSTGFAAYFTWAAAYAVPGINNPGLEEQNLWFALMFFVILQVFSVAIFFGIQLAGARLASR